MSNFEIIANKSQFKVNYISDAPAKSLCSMSLIPDRRLVPSDDEPISSQAETFPGFIVLMPAQEPDNLSSAALTLHHANCSISSMFDDGRFTNSGSIGWSSAPGTPAGSITFSSSDKTTTRTGSVVIRGQASTSQDVINATIQCYVLLNGATLFEEITEFTINGVIFNKPATQKSEPVNPNRLTTKAYVDAAIAQAIAAISKD